MSGSNHSPDRADEAAEVPSSLSRAEQFTAGPWSLSEMHANGLYLNGGEAVVMAGEPLSDDRVRVCQVDCHTKAKRGQAYRTECAVRNANARLIAAAPTMFAYIAARAAGGDLDARDIVEAINA